jgi:hypothetical protein
MKIVIQTQYRENYAAHNEDYVPGVSEDYWKFKGGDTYIVNDATADQAQSSSFWDELEALVTYHNDASEEYILDMQVIDDMDFKAEDHFQEWETPTYITQAEYGFIATKKTLNGEFGYMRPEIESRFETWTMLPRQERKFYSSSFTMKDGLILSSDELKQYFCEAA